MGNDGLQIGLVALRVLLIDDDLVRAVAAFGKAVDEALIGLIQRAVLDNLDDADLDLSCVRACAVRACALWRLPAASSVYEC